MDRTFDFIGNSSDGVFAVDGEQTIVLWNDRAAEILGFSAEEVTGKKCYGIVCGRDAEGSKVCRNGCQAMTSAKQLEPAATTDIAARTKEGDEVWLNLSTVVVPSRRGDLSVMVHMFREVTRDHEVLSSARDFADMVSAEETGKLPLVSRGGAGDNGLTPREQEVLGFLAAGLSTDSIAGKLRISPRTVRNHVNNILGKLGVHSRLEAVTHAIHHGLV